MNVLMVTSEWPTADHPERVPFVVQQVAYLRGAGIHVDVLSFRGAKNPRNYVKAWLQVRKRLRFHRYDLIHAQFGQSGLTALPNLLPLVVTFHGSDLQGWVGANGKYSTAGRIMQKASRVVARYADQIIVVSEHLTQYLPANISVNLIPCGVDLELFRPIPQLEARKQLGMPLDQGIILFVGDPANPIKRFSLAQQAFELVKNKMDVILSVANGIPHEIMPLYMNACDTLVLTSKHEGSPTVIKEALACNLPVVSVDVGDVRERIGSVDGCVVCETDKPEMIARALEAVLSYRQRINGWQSMMDLDERLLTQKVIHVYQSALSKAKS